MRILTFTSLFPNAVRPSTNIFIYQRVAALAMRPGNEVRVVAPIPYLPKWLPRSSRSWMNDVPKQETIGNLNIYHPRYLLIPKLSMPLQGWSMFRGSRDLVERLREDCDFDCIDAHYIYPDCFAAVLLGRHLGKPVMVSGRGTDINLFPSFRLIRPMIRWTLRNAAGITAVSHALKCCMSQLVGGEQEIRVIGNGVDVERFHPVDRQVARRQLGIAEDCTMIVAVGGLLQSKGFQFLIRAFGELTPRYPNLSLYIIGEGPFRASLQDLIQSLRLSERASLVGARPHSELKYWFSAADVSCLPSMREGQPNVVLESLACGTPVVASKVGGIPEVLDSPKLGMLAEDLHSLAPSLEQALHTNWDRRQLALHVAQRTWYDVALEVEEYLKTICECWREGMNR